MQVLEPLQVADKLSELGVKAKNVKLYTDAGMLFDADFKYLKGDTRFPYMLLVSQYTTERILEKKAVERGIKVERPYRLVGLSDSEDESIVATFDNGRRVKAKYVIGADGSHSAVRQLVNVNFADPDGASIDDKNVTQMVLAEVTLSPNPTNILPRDQVFRYTSKSNSCLAIPIPRSRYPEAYDSSSDSIYRIEFNIPKEDGPPPTSPDAAYFQKYLDKIRPTFLYPGKKGAGSIKINKVFWSRRFLTHSAIAEKYLVRLHKQNGRSNPRVVFLVGDAAHVHSPIGGQGMNLGLREAIGLAPVLLKHMKLFPHDPSSADKLVENYASMRHEVALKTIHVTKRSTSIQTMLGTLAHGWRRYFILWAVRLFFMLPFVVRRLAWELSGLGRA